MAAVILPLNAGRLAAALRQGTVSDLAAEGIGRALASRCRETRRRERLQQFAGNAPTPQRLQSRYPVMAHRGPVEHVFAGRGADQHVVRPLAFILPADEPAEREPFQRRALDGSHTGHARSDGGSGHDRAHYRAAPLHALRVRGLSGLVGADGGLGDGQCLIQLVHALALGKAGLVDLLHGIRHAASQRQRPFKPLGVDRLLAIRLLGLDGHFPIRLLSLLHI